MIPLCGSLTSYSLRETENPVTEALTLRETLVFTATNNSVALLLRIQEAAVEDGHRRHRWFQAKEEGGGVQYVIYSFELQPESQMMLL